MSTPANKPHSLGIVGFGAGGLSLFVQIVDACIENKLPISIQIFDKENFARGQAYGTSSAAHILNLDIHTMSVAHTKPDHFYQWLCRKKTDGDAVNAENMFPPRAVFGQYLDETFKEYLAKAQDAGISVTTTIADITDAEAKGPDISLIDSKQSIYLMNSVALCVGNLPSDSYSKLKGIPGYIHSPWKEKTPQDPAASVAVVGSRLTAIDIALRLTEGSESTNTNPVILVSRSGMLPKIIGPASAYELSFLSESSIRDQIGHSGKLPLKKLVQLFRSEIEKAEGREVPWDKLQSPTTVQSLEDEVQLVKNNVPRPWQSVLIAFYPLVPWTWGLLSDGDKKSFLRKYLGAWLTYLAAFPCQNAEKVLQLMRSGKINLISGVRKIKYDKSKRKFLILHTHGKLSVDVLINATGSGHSLENSRLLFNLKNREIIREDAGGGVSISPQSCETLPGSHLLDSKIYAIGETTFGDWLATADLGQVSRQAELVAKDLIARIRI